MVWKDCNSWRSRILVDKMCPLDTKGKKFTHELLTLWFPEEDQLGQHWKEEKLHLVSPQIKNYKRLITTESMDHFPPGWDLHMFSQSQVVNPGHRQIWAKLKAPSGLQIPTYMHSKIIKERPWIWEGEELGEEEGWKWCR